MSTELNGNIALHPGKSHEQILYKDALEAYQRNSNWWTVFATFDLPDFSPSPIWITKKTGLNIEEVVEAIEGLAVLGFLKKENGAFYPVKDKSFVSFDNSKRDKAEVLDEHAVISQQILNHLSSEARVAYDHRCIAANKEIIVDLYRDILTAFDKAFQKSQEVKNNDGIFKITFTAVDVVPANETTGRGN